eukprot:m.559600 g.559600  ORF g.559600 m.559600 type:complete len:480 (-) comp22206_c0_seq5:1423-2862(-)
MLASAVLLASFACVCSLQVRSSETYSVVVHRDITYGQGLVCTDRTYVNCTAFNLTLDAYVPVPTDDAETSPLSPAIVLSHGGGNSGGAKGQGCFVGTANFFASRGFVAFDINYRLSGQNGKIPSAARPKAGSSIVAQPRSGVNCLAIQPHPNRTSSNGNASEPYTGPLYTAGVSGALCLTAPSGTTPAAITLQPCITSSAIQQHFQRRAGNSIGAEMIVHVASGRCVAWTGTIPRQTMTLASCNASDPLQQWVLGFSGVLFTETNGDTCAGAATTVRSALQWAPNWQSGYPAVRDLKAAIRYVRAMAEGYGIDAGKVAVSGGSAGATNSLAAGVVFEDDYKSELSLADDPTLATTHLSENSSVQCVYTHWSSHQEVDLVTSNDPQHRVRWGRANAPIIEFHGAKDHTIDISQAYQTQAEYNKSGVAYSLNVMPDCAHAAWCYGCGEQCTCANKTGGYCPHMDTVAFPFVTTHLGVGVLP